MLPMNENASEAAAENFEALGLVKALLDCLVELGYEEPTPIQAEAIPPLLAGRDLLAEAPTGTGKSAAAERQEARRRAGPRAVQERPQLRW